ncbi:MAG TPA: efflux RND transporter periplasmic adaptor subunit [Bacteroidales bacterium]|nr:efflux RND transporter periplasmic adaptor subunit [Bacteroidales bacterium]HON20536.1 efflux RND transporter periplasmic adaptor subunit [Bacteroidales bacterium]HOR82313.1 efflux RND transporter periplasmic adaptor subunit [Bacteroidales bacterium]HPJ91918.1 efflux RND transporter periplasmic adaptor subunit [Bacteroidales bacterium]
MLKLKSIFLYTALILFASCQDYGTKHSIEAVNVEVMKVKLHTDTLYQNYIGKIEEEFSSSLSFSVPGNVEQVFVNEGEYVEKGKLLATLNKENLQSTYNASVATLKQAEDAYERLEQLYKKGSIPEIQWIEMITNFEKAKSAEKIAKKNLEDANLYAQFSGIIGKRNLERGMYVMPTMQVIDLLSTKNIIVRVPIPENIISFVSIGQTAKITVSALNNRYYEGKVNMKGIVANPLSHCYEITIPVENRDKQLMPGMICKVQLVADDTSQVIVVPIQAVKLTHDGKHFVWLAVNGKAHKQYVKIGTLTDFGVVISEGLSDNNLVIVKGYQKVSEGTNIKIQ